MRIYLKILTVFAALIWQAPVASATTCADPKSQDPAVWDQQLCSLSPLVPNARCWSDNVAAGYFRMLCASTVNGCDQIPGGCIGTLTTGNWALVFINAGGTMVQHRCLCGCVAEESRFATTSGEISGTELLEIQSNGGNLPQLLSSNEQFGHSYAGRSIQNLIAGPEKDPAIEVHTAAGVSVTLSAEHPVVVADASGNEREMRQAQALEKGLYLLTFDGYPDRIERIHLVPYTGRVVNFEVSTHDNANHQVIVNGFKMGDNTWQQYLVKRDARIMSRNDILKSLYSNNQK